MVVQAEQPCKMQVTLHGLASAAMCLYAAAHKKEKIQKPTPFGGTMGASVP